MTLYYFVLSLGEINLVRNICNNNDNAVLKKIKFSSANCKLDEKTKIQSKKKVL